MCGFIYVYMYVRVFIGIYDYYDEDDYGDIYDDGGNDLCRNV